MSLSFVSKTIQTTREDGGFDEKPVEGAELHTSVARTSKPLFEQLRDNQEQEDAERAEQQKAMMRGTLALDDEDCAHLEFLRKQRIERENERERQASEELAAFRAAQADRLEEEPRGKANAVVVSSAEKLNVQPKLPIVVKKRKRVDANANTQKKEKTNSSAVTTENRGATSTGDKDEMNGNLGSLLSGYGSSSDESET